MNYSEVVCYLHRKEFIAIDTNDFKFVCKKCIEMKIDNLDSFLLTSNKYKDNEIPIKKNDQNEIFKDLCSKQIKEIPGFFCKNSQELICTTCFTSIQSKYNSRTIKIISKTIRDEINLHIKFLNEANFEDSLKLLKEIKQKIKIHKNIKFKSSSQVNIINALNERKSFIKKIYNHFCERIEIEIEQMNQKLNSLIKIFENNINFINDNLVMMKSCLSEKKACIIHKKIKNDMKIIPEFIKETIYYFKNIFNEKKIKIQNSIPNYNDSLDKILKTLKTDEKSIINSIISGITSPSFRLRRYIKYDMMCRYFKTSSLELKLDIPLSLIGIGLCGLYDPNIIESQSLILNKEYEKNYDLHNIQLENKDTNNQFDKVIERFSLQISISFSEIREDDETINIMEFNYILKSVSNTTDPIIFLHFPKAINLKAETNYLITITNNDKNQMYLQIFGGTVPKSSLNILEQSLSCNNSRINFFFKAVSKIESDFNEFNFGILSDLLYCYVD